MIKISSFLLQALVISLISFQTISAESPPKKDTSILIQEGDIIISRQDALMMLKEMSTGQKNLALSNLEKFENMLIDQLTLEKKALASIKDNLDKDPLIQWKLQRSKNLILSNALMDNFRNNVSTPKDLELLAREYYDAHLDKFFEPERIKAAHILFKFKETDDAIKKNTLKALANSVLSELQNGEIDFTEAVKEHSQDPGTSKTGGVLDFFTRGRMVKPFEDAAFNLKQVDDISEVVESRFGYHIIKLIDRHESKTTPYDQVKHILLEAQTKKFISKKVAAYIDQFNTNENTIIYRPAVQKLISELSSK